MRRQGVRKAAAPSPHALNLAQGPALASGLAVLALPLRARARVAVQRPAEQG